MLDDIPDTACDRPAFRATQGLNLLGDIRPVEVRVIHPFTGREAPQQAALPLGPRVKVEIVVAHAERRYHHTASSPTRAPARAAMPLLRSPTGWNREADQPAISS